MDGLRVERQSSIENEPRTLDNNQLDFAREAALYVVNTRSNQEALNIFTKGLEPVARCGEDELISGGNGEAAAQTYGINVEVVSDIRDILSAPF